jgi:hypothetical protein
MDTYTIYGLMHPIFMSFYYVGVTSNPLSQRIYQHSIEAQKELKSSTRAKKVSKSLYANNVKPLAIVLDTIIDDGRQYGYTLEKMWMAHISKCGHPLLNSDAKKWEAAYTSHVFSSIQQLHDCHRRGLSYDEYEMKLRRPPELYFSSEEVDRFVSDAHALYEASV